MKIAFFEILIEILLTLHARLTLRPKDRVGIFDFYIESCDSVYICSIISQIAFESHILYLIIDFSFDFLLKIQVLKDLD